MSETNRLGISITAKDNNANATIQQLRATAKGLEETLASVGGTARDASGKITAALQTELKGINEQIAARVKQVEAIKAVTSATQATTAALVQQGDASGVIHRNLSQALNVAIGAEREINSATESAKLFVTSLSAMASTEPILQSVNEALAEQLTIQKALIAATYENNDLRLQGAKADREYAVMRREADILNEAQGPTRRPFVKTPSGGEAAASGVSSTSKEMRHLVAAFDEISRGQKGALFGTMGAAARDAGLGVAALGGSMVGLVAIMGSAAILHGAERMGAWATKTREAASAAGMSVQSYSSLQGALSLVGIKADSADATLRRLAVNLSTALADPTSKAAEAFHNLGISQEELESKGSTTAGALKLLADAFLQTADSENKSAAMAQLFGRGFEAIIPALQGGSAQLEELEEKARSLGLTLTDETAKKLQETGESVENLSQRIRGDGIKAFEEWAPAISAVVNILGECLDLIIKVVGAVGSLPSAFFSTGGVSGSSTAVDMLRRQAALHGALNPSGAGAAFGPPTSSTNAMPAAGSATGLGAQRDVPAMTTPESVMAAMRQQMTAAALGASHGGDRQAEDRAEIAVMQKTLATAKLTAEERSQITTEMQQKEIQLNNSITSAGTKAAKQSYEDFAANERLKIAEAQGSSTQITAIYNQWEKAAESTYRQSAAVVVAIEREKVQAINAARLDEIKEGARLEEQNNRANLVMGQASAISSGTMVYPGQKTIGGQAQTSGQGTAALAAQAQQIEAAAQKEVQSLTEVMNAATAGSNVQKQAAEEILSVVTQAKSQEVALYNKAAEAAVQAAAKSGAALTKVFDSIGTQFETFTDSLMKALIAPQVDLIKQGFTTEKFSMQGNEIRAALSKMLMSGIQDATKGVESALSQMLGSMLSNALSIPMQAGGGLASVISGGLMKAVGGGAASALPSSASFGLAGTSLTTAGTTLQAAATTLQLAATSMQAGGAASAVGGAGGAAAATPIIGAINSSSALDVVTQTTAASTVNAATTQSSTFLGGVIQGGNAIIASLLGALNIKPSVLGFSYSSGGIVPSAAGGMVTGGMGASLAILHSKEMVLPAHLSEGIQGMINGGQGRGNTSNASLNYSPTINTASRSRGGTGMTRGEFSQMMSTHGGSMLGEARSMMRNGWRPRGG